MDVRKALSGLPRQIKGAAAVLVVALSFYYLGSNIVRGLNEVDLSKLRLQPAPLILSLLLFMISNFIGGWCWSLILEGLGQKLPLYANIRIHLSANLVKYVPGYAWQILGKAYLCNRQGVPGAVIGIGIALELASIVLTGVWVASLALPLPWLDAWGLGMLWPWRIPGLIVLTGLLIALPWLLRRGLQSFQAGRFQEIVIRRQSLWLVLSLMVTAWAVLGLAVYSFTRALYPLNPADLPPLTFSWAASSILGLAVIFVPAGIGVREGALAFLLGFRLPMAVAAAAAALTRVLSIVSEVLCFLITQRLPVPKGPFEPE